MNPTHPRPCDCPECLPILKLPEAVKADWDRLRAFANHNFTQAAVEMGLIHGMVPPDAWWELAKSIGFGGDE